jgi:hypothetical protein
LYHAVHRLVALLIGAVLCLAGPVQGQGIRLEVQDRPLEEAIERLRAVTGLDVVYAERLVRGRRATCTYVGDEREEALDCVLQGSGLRADRVRRGQYVLVAATGAPQDTVALDPLREPLTGHVIDGETGERLPGAHVYLTALEAGATTNRAGYFALSSLPPGPYEVRVTFLGYQPVDTTLVAGGGPYRVVLDPAAIESEGVVVEAGTTDESGGGRRPGMMAVALDRLAQLPSLGEPDLFKALQWTPGIRKSGAVGGGLSVRGADPDQNLYLLDGAPVYHPWHAFSLISTFQTGTLKNTNLYRGSFPAHHGGRLSSVLDAQLKDGSRSEPAAVAALSFLSGRFRIEAPVTEQTSFMLSARRSYIDKLVGRRHTVTDATGRRDTLRTGYYFYDTTAKVSHRFGRDNRLAVSYYGGRDDLDLRLPFDLSLDFSSWLRPADLFFEIEQNWENRLLSVQHQYLAAPDLFLTTTGYFSGYRAQEASLVQPTTTASLRSDYRVRLGDAGLKVDAEYYYSVAHQLRAGLKVSGLQFESTLESDLQRSSGDVETQADTSVVDAVEAVAFVEDTWSPTPEWMLQPGVRVSYFSNGGHLNVAPRLSTRYSVHPRFLILRASAGLHVQYLHRLRDRYSLAYDLVSSRWVPASRAVRPARGLNLGFSARSQPVPWLTLEVTTYARGTRRLLVPADVFQTKDGLEGPGIEVSALLGQYTPADERAFGTEVSAILDRGPWSARLGFATGRTFVRAPERSGPRWRPADLDVPVSIRGTASWTGGPWEISLATEVRSGYPLSVPSARYRLGDVTKNEATTYLYRPAINNGRLPTYLRVDATLGYRFSLLSADWKARLNVFNVIDRENVVDRTYAPVDAGVRVRNQRGLPLLPLLELEMRL